MDSLFKSLVEPWPSLQAIMSRFGSKETPGKRLGLFQSAFSLAFIFPPVIAGFLMETFGPQAIFYNGAALMTVATLLGVILLPRSVSGSDNQHLQDEMPAESGGLLQHFHH